MHDHNLKIHENKVHTPLETDTMME